MFETVFVHAVTTGIWGVYSRVKIIQLANCMIVTNSLLQLMVANSSTPGTWMDYYQPQNGVSV